MKKKLLFGLSTCLLAFGIAGGVSAAGTWSPEATLDLPGNGGDVYGASNGVPNKNKVSSDVNAAFQGISKTSAWSVFGKLNMYEMAFKNVTCQYILFETNFELMILSSDY